MPNAQQPGIRMRLGSCEEFLRSLKRCGHLASGIVGRPKRKQHREVRGCCRKPCLQYHATCTRKNFGHFRVGKSPSEPQRDAVEGAQSLDQDKIADYIRTHTFKTVIGDVEFGEKGEWKKARLMTIQFQNIASTSVDDFRDGKGEVVLWPDQYKAGEPILPYSSIKH